MLCPVEQLRSSGGSDMKPAMQSSNSGLMRDVANDFHEVMNAQTPLVVITKAQSVDKAKVSSARRGLSLKFIRAYARVIGVVGALGFIRRRVFVPDSSGSGRADRPRPQVADSFA